MLPLFNKNMDGIKERIKKIRKKLNISQQDFAKKIYISQTLLGEIELGNRTATDKTIQLIFTEFNVNKEWIINGTGDMFTDPPPDMQLEKIIEMYKQLDKPLRDYLLEQIKGLLKLQKSKTE